MYLDVSRVGFTYEFVKEMEPRFQAELKAMEEIEKGAIANPDEGCMVVIANPDFSIFFHCSI